jgi:predicted histidine transporter YuiF (NhaC family)
MEVITNPVVIAVVVMLALCLLKVNVFISLLASAIVGAIVSPFLSGMELGIGGRILEGMRLIIGGMAAKNNVILSYILLGGLAVAISYTGIVKILCHKLLKAFGDKRILTAFIIAGVACLSQNLIPVHIAFIPILIPPLLYVFNKLQLDRRAIALSLTFGLKAPYLLVPMGFGLMFHGIVATNMNLAQEGIIQVEQVAGAMFWPFMSMVIGLVVGILFIYKKPRIYENRTITLDDVKPEDLVFTSKHMLTIVAILICFGVQTIIRGIGSWGWFGIPPASIPPGTAGLGLHVGALFAIIFMFVTKCVSFKEMDDTMRDGIKLMGNIVIVMLAAGGFAGVMNAAATVEGGSAVRELVNAIISVSGTSPFGIATAGMIIGTIVTMGIGTSFGTIPIIAPIFVPLGLIGGMSPVAIACMIGTAAAIGDAGSPASDSTLGPTAGLDADGQHNHIYDTCVPTFIFFNIPLIIFGIIAPAFLL